MEMIGFTLFCLILAGWATCEGLRRRRLQQEVYDYAAKLDRVLTEMREGCAPDVRIGKQDDLWGHTNEQLLRLAHQTAAERAALSEEREALKSLVADISHQTKTPLANIRLYLERLANGESEEILLPRLQAQVEKLNFLLAGMVKTSRLETGAITIRKQNVPLAPTLAEALAAVVPQAEAKQIRLYADVDEGLCLNHDLKWTSEAVYNLLDNAVKYTMPGGEVHLRVVRQPEFTEIRVQDNGKGIERERQGAIFGRFYREPEVHDNEGCGLGLYLARRIVTMQGGFIEVSSEVGRGSTFSINLPN